MRTISVTSNVFDCPPCHEFARLIAVMSVVLCGGGGGGLRFRRREFRRCRGDPHGQDDQAQALRLQPVLNFQRLVIMQEPADETVEFVGEDELASEKYRVRELARDFETQTLKLDDDVGSDRGAQLGME